MTQVQDLYQVQREEEMRIQVIFGILFIYTQVVMGSLFQDAVVCTFTQRNQCYVAVGERLELQMPWEDGFDLKTPALILRYRKTQSSPPTPRLPRWQFINDNKTMILTSAERNNSGTYTLITFNVDGSSKGSYTLQVNIEAQVSSVKVSYRCSPPGIMEVTCAADGDNLHFNWTSDFIELPRLEDGTSTVKLEQHHQGNVTCHVENHVSRDYNTIELLQCPNFMVFVSVWLFQVIILLSLLVAFYIYNKISRKQRITERNSVNLD